MPGLAYPFVFVCSSCGARVTVTRAEAADLWPDPDERTAVVRTAESLPRMSVTVLSRAREEQ